MREVNFVDGFTSASEPTVGPAIDADSVNETHIRLTNNGALKGRNAANSANILLLKVNTSDKGELVTETIHNHTPTLSTSVTNKSYVDSTSIINALIFG